MKTTSLFYVDEQVYLPKRFKNSPYRWKSENNSLIKSKLYVIIINRTLSRHFKKYLKVVKCNTCGTSKTSIRKDKNGRPRWVGDELNGYDCELCDKKKYYIDNKKRISDLEKNSG